MKPSLLPVIADRGFTHTLRGGGGQEAAKRRIPVTQDSVKDDF